jgi:hypothetical protein
METMQGTLISPDSVQAKNHPEIANTSCFVVVHQSGSNADARKVWIQANGPIPIDPHSKTGRHMYVCHKCDNIYGPCVNLDHIFLGTCKDNMIDCSVKKRFQIQNMSHEDNVKRVKKCWETIRENIKNGKQYHIGLTSEQAKNIWKARRKNGTDHVTYHHTLEQSKNIWKARRKNGTYNKPEAFKLMWETRREKYGPSGKS